MIALRVWMDSCTAGMLLFGSQPKMKYKVRWFANKPHYQVSGDQVSVQPTQEFTLKKGAENP